ncbi:MAG: hypothetical protein K2M19_07595 [Muribaculaceae bacterium]|nr:hypothetical protein [Muribaculaceae bacterium]
MRNFITKLSVILLLTAISAACSEPKSVPTPRPRSYHRPIPADTASAVWTDGGNRWIHNTEATAISPREGWLTVSYPRRSMTLYITYTRARGVELAEARINRMERLLLNTGSGPAVEQEFTNPQGWQIYLMKSQSLTTPVQFLATDGTSTLVSGSLQSTADADDYEAIRPDVDIVSRDILASLGQLGADENN